MSSGKAWIATGYGRHDLEPSPAPCLLPIEYLP